MFLTKYLNSFYYNELLDNYQEEYLNTLDEENFIKIYSLLKKCNFYYIEDIILKYLPIFTKDYQYVYNKIVYLKNKLGPNYIYLIGNNLQYLDAILV